MAGSFVFIVCYFEQASYFFVVDRSFIVSGMGGTDAVIIAYDHLSPLKIIPKTQVAQTTKKHWFELEMLSKSTSTSSITINNNYITQGGTILLLVRSEPTMSVAANISTTLKKERTEKRNQNNSHLNLDRNHIRIPRVLKKRSPNIIEIVDTLADDHYRWQR